MAYFRIYLGIFVIFLSGCRFGNYVDPGPEPWAEIWRLSTEVQNLEAVVILSDVNPDGSNQLISNPNTTLSAVPASIAAIFPNPVQLVLPRDQNLIPFFYNPANQLTLGTQLNSSLAILSTSASEIVPLWRSESCLTQVQLNQDGGINRQITSSETDGHLSLDLTWVRLFEGDCQADLEELAFCYANPSQCDRDAVDASTTLFDLHVRSAGILNLDSASLSKVLGLAYIVSFQ